MRLEIQEPDKPPREIDAVDGLTIGRGSTNACGLDDESSSTSHARIVLVDGRLAVEDLGSTNGTRIEGGSRLGRGETFLLSPGLVIRVGNSRIRVVGAPAVPEAVTMRPAKVAEDLGATRPRGEPPIENVTLRPSRPAASPVPENATQRPAPKEGHDAPTMIPSAPQATPPTPSATASARTPTPMPPVSRPPSQSIPIPATIPKAGDPAAPDDLGIGGTMIVGGGVTDPAAIQAKLAALKPRLVFVAHKVGRSEAITERETRIGRRKNGPVAIGLDDEGVSGNHGLLSFDGRAFFLEDLDSKNGTWVGEAKLGPRPNRLEVRCDQKVRFGTVDALFVRSPETGETPSPADAYPGALASLAQDALVPQDKLREAQAQLAQGLHPGEFLIAANAIPVTRWCEAIESARLRRQVSAGAPGGGSSRMVWILGAALVAAAAVIAVLLKR